MGFWSTLTASATPPWSAIPLGEQIHGSVVAEVVAADGTPHLLLVPDAVVFLSNPSMPGIPIIGPVQTAPTGSFAIPPVAIGSYRLCWQGVGFEADCLDDLVQVGRDLVSLDSVTIVPRPNVVFGRVLLADGSVPLFQDTTLAIDAHATVQLLTPVGQLLAVTQTNIQGDYLFGGLAPGQYLLRAQVEAEVIEQPITVGGSWTEANLNFLNRPPTILSAVAKKNGVEITHPEPGDTVTLQVKAQDDGPLEFLWYPGSWTADFAPPASSGAREFSWTVPNAEGRHTMYVVVRDGRGGYASDRFDLYASHGRLVLFGGSVVGLDGSPVADATATLNGVDVAFDAPGFFSVEVPETLRYLLDIRAPNAQLISKVLNGQITLASYPLMFVEPRVIDPTQPTYVLGPGMGRPRPYIQIPPNSIVDPEGKPALGPLLLCLSLIDLSDPFERLPGDGGAIDSAGELVRLEPWSAIELRIKDIDGNEYDFAPDAMITVGFPIQRYAFEPTPHEVNMWDYAEAEGVYRPSGFGPAVVDGGYLVAQIGETGVKAAAEGARKCACIQVKFDREQLKKLSDATLRLKVAVTDVDGQPPKIRDMSITRRDAVTTIDKLKPNAATRVELVFRAGPDVNRDFVMPNTAIVVDTTPGHDCGTEREHCHKVELKTPAPIPAKDQFLKFRNSNDNQIATLYYAAIDSKRVDLKVDNRPVLGSTGDQLTEITLNPPIPANANLLHGGEIIEIDGQVVMIRPPEGSQEITRLALRNPVSRAIRDKPIKKVGEKPTFDDWKEKNGYVADRVVNARYSNQLDLGFGRDMVMWKNDQGIFYYVGNYDDALAACKRDQLAATVAMEYRKAAPFATFYVFDERGNREINVDLDGDRVKSIPALCIICHGGQMPTPKEFADSPGRFPKGGDLGSRFIPFSLDGYGFAGDCTKAGQQKAFKALNDGCLETDPTPAIRELVGKWYAGADPDRPVQNESAFPDGWANVGGTEPSQRFRQNVYLNVVRPSCRSCHVTRTGNLDFATWAKFDGRKGVIEDRVCDDRTMPNARLTYLQFWNSVRPGDANPVNTIPYQPRLLKTVGILPEDCGVTLAPVTP